MRELDHSPGMDDTTLKGALGPIIVVIAIATVISIGCVYLGNHNVKVKAEQVRQLEAQEQTGDPI